MGGSALPELACKIFQQSVTFFYGFRKMGNNQKTIAMKNSGTMKKIGRFVVAFTIFALYTSFSPSDGTIEDPSISSAEQTHTEQLA